jgi:hypothetical protein
MEEGLDRDSPGGVGGESMHIVCVAACWIVVSGHLHIATIHNRILNPHCSQPPHPSAEAQDAAARRWEHRRPEARRSSFRGVQWDRNGGKWRARIHTDKTRHIGYYDDEKEAAEEWDLAAIRYFGNEVRGRGRRRGYRRGQAHGWPLDALGMRWGGSACILSCVGGVSCSLNEQ